MSSEMTEFKITSDLTALRGQVIEANFDEVREWLDTNLAPYRDLAVTPDTIATAKNYRATIRKVRDRIDEARKEAKSAALAAYSAFEAKCKELTSLCDDAAGSIDAQVKELEEGDKKQKIDAIHAKYDELADAEIQSYIPWGVINNPKWGNKTVSFDSAVADIEFAIENTRNDLAAIRTMGGDDTPYLLDIYRQTRDLSSVVRKASEIKTIRQKEEQREREKAERNAFSQAITMAAAERVSEILSAEHEQPKIVTVSFTVKCTEEQLGALGRYMHENGIWYGRV